MFTQKSLKDYPDSKTVESVSLLSLSYIPPIVVKHLKSNFKLLDEKKIEFITQELEKEPYGRYSKSRFGFSYGIYYNQDGIFAIFNKTNKFYQFFFPKKNQIILGSGAFGYVKLAQNLLTGEWKALKVEILNKDNDEKTKIKNKEFFFSECCILNKLALTKDDKGIIKNSRKNSYIEKGNALMDLAIGEQLLFLHRIRKDSDSELFWPDLIWLDIAIQAAEALKKLHEKNLFHRDIKLENFIWDIARKKLTLIDFGFTVECKLDSKGNKFVSDLALGTWEYCAPEILAKTKKACVYTEKTDIYSLGICFQEILLNCTVKWDSWSKEAVIFYHATTNLENDESLGITDLIEDMTDYHPDRRPMLNTIIKNLNYAKEVYILKYPKEYEITQEIYKKAQQLELSRLMNIYQYPKNDKLAEIIGHKSSSLKKEC